MKGINKNANHNHWKLLIQLPVARSTLWARPPESRSSTASVFSPSTLSTKRWVGAFFLLKSSTVNITHYLDWKGVSPVMKRCFCSCGSGSLAWPSSPGCTWCSGSPVSPSHLSGAPHFDPFPSIYFQVDAPSCKGQSFHPLRPGNLSTGFEFESWVSISR